jgi:hypothetical protein
VLVASWRESLPRACRSSHAAGEALSFSGRHGSRAPRNETRRGQCVLVCTACELVPACRWSVDRCSKRPGGRRAICGGCRVKRFVGRPRDPTLRCSLVQSDPNPHGK